MGSALRVLLTVALILVGLSTSACGKRGSLDRPKPNYPETKMSQAPNRSLWIDRLLQ
jgi:predicted small lipoprotein YifL